MKCKIAKQRMAVDYMFILHLTNKGIDWIPLDLLKCILYLLHTKFHLMKMAKELSVSITKYKFFYKNNVHKPRLQFDKLHKFSSKKGFYNNFFSTLFGRHCHKNYL